MCRSRNDFAATPSTRPILPKKQDNKVAKLLIYPTLKSEARPLTTATLVPNEVLWNPRCDPFESGMEEDVKATNSVMRESRGFLEQDV